MNIRTFGGSTPQISESVFVDETALVIGDVHIAEDASLWPYVVARGDVHRIRIGARSNIQDHTVLHVSHDSQYLEGGAPLTIGEDVTVGHRAILHGCTVGDRCLIGMAAVVMDGAELGDDIILGAGSLVTAGKQLEGGYLYRGSPASQARALTSAELEYLKYSAAHYCKLKDQHRG